MKPSLAKFTTCSFLVIFPLFLTIAFLSTFAQGNADLREGETCSRYYDGIEKGIFWRRGEWHHYVDFSVGPSVPGQRWRIIKAPLPSTISRGIPSEFLERVTYRWPSNWWDPFPAKSWQICFLDP